MIHVTFDSNLFQNIVFPDNYKDDESSEHYWSINKLIKEERIVACISETIFIYEVIAKNERKRKLAQSKPKTSCATQANGSIVSMQMSIGPGANSHLFCHPILYQYLEACRKMKVKVLRTPRIGTFVNDDLVDDDFLPDKRYEISKRHKRFFECLEFIEDNLKCGKNHMDTLIAPYEGRNVFSKIKNAPESDIKKVSQAMAEWADGDSVAAHYGYGNDYFCTRDIARGAGSKSIFSISNRAKLKKEFDISIIGLEDLVAYLEHINN